MADLTVAQRDLKLGVGRFDCCTERYDFGDGRFDCCTERYEIVVLLPNSEQSRRSSSTLKPF